MLFPNYESYKDNGGKWVEKITSLRSRSIEEVTAEILQLEQETEGLLKRLVSLLEVK